MVFESVEISTPAQEDVAVSWPAIAAGAIAAAALTLVLLAFGAGMGFSAVSPWGNSGISASTFQITTGLYLIVVALLASAMGGICRRAIAYKMGRCPYPRSLLPRYSSWLFGVGIGHCDRRRVSWPRRPATLLAAHHRDLQRHPMCRQLRAPAAIWIIMWMPCCDPILPQARMLPIREQLAAKLRAS